jgi:hypothetical protein
MSVLFRKESRSGHITSAYLPVELVISAKDFSHERKSPIQAFCRGNMPTHKERQDVNFEPARIDCWAWLIRGGESPLLSVSMDLAKLITPPAAER